MIWDQSRPPWRPRDWEVGWRGPDASGIGYITASTLFETDDDRIPLLLLFIWMVLIRPLVYPLFAQIRSLSYDLCESCHFAS